MLINILPQFISKRIWNMMQRKQWQSLARNMEDSKNLCVGSFADHENYPYEKYLLAHYQGQRENAFDFGCGIGRMIKRMLSEFRVVDGGELLTENLDYAKQYLRDCNSNSYNLHKLDGLGCDIRKSDCYDLIYSTICVHHIAPFSIRDKIFHDFYQLLKVGGAISIQVVYGIDTGNHWFNDPYAEATSNRVIDVSIPSTDHFPEIEKWLHQIGFKNVKFDIAPCPHPNADPNLKWLFIFAEKR